MNNKKLTDALTALETSTQLHKDAIGYSQRAIEKNQEAVKLLTEAMIHETTNYEVQLNPAKYILHTDDGIKFFATDDSYRKYIVDLAKEEIADLENVTLETDQDFKDEDIIERKSERHGVAETIELDDIFITNKEKRTVVYLAKGTHSKHVYFRGVAKCHENDTFNEHIGKVIAFYKAAGKEVPEIFTNVPNPEKVENGDIVKHPLDAHGWEIDHIVTVGDFVHADYRWKSFDYKNNPIIKNVFEEFKTIDDSNRK